MERIFSRAEPSRLLHVIYRMIDAECLKDQRFDITAPQESLQIGLMKPPMGKYFKAHRHITKAQHIDNFQVQEAFIVIRGEILVHVYDVDNVEVEVRSLYVGDVALLISGGHALTIIDKDTIFYEVKTGPYEGQAGDKTFIE